MESQKRHKRFNWQNWTTWQVHHAVAAYISIANANLSAGNASLLHSTQCRSHTEQHEICRATNSSTTTIAPTQSPGTSWPTRYEPVASRKHNTQFNPNPAEQVLTKHQDHTQFNSQPCYQGQDATQPHDSQRELGWEFSSLIQKCIHHITFTSRECSQIPPRFQWQKLQLSSLSFNCRTQTSYKIIKSWYASSTTHIIPIRRIGESNILHSASSTAYNNEITGSSR
jgi:hypothetical protein